MEQVLRLSAEATTDAHNGRRKLPDEIHSWYAGAVGERRVADILSRLGDEWTVLHSVPVGSEGSDIDHVLIGPAGVYTINTKHHANKDVWVAGRALRVSNHPQHHISNAAFEARRAAKLLTQASGLTVETAGVVVVVGARKLVIKAAPDGDDVTVGVERDSELLGALQSRRIYSDEQVQRIVDAAVRPRTWSLLPVSTVDPRDLQSHFEALEPELAADARRLSQVASKGAATARPQRTAPSRPPSRRPSKKRRSILPGLMKLAVFAVALIIAVNYLGSLGAPSAPAPASFASAELEQSALSQAAGTAAFALDQLSPSGVRPASLVIGEDSTLKTPDGSVVVALPVGTTADYAPSADGLSYTLTLTGPQHGSAVTVTPEAGVVPAPATAS
ncbi:nuclease-related domain-containing protein [Microterricola gilva]|nr:nuclease-related domain-containing protein [Microterricola gilva]